MFKRTPHLDRQKSSTSPEEFLSQPSARLPEPILVLQSSWRPMNTIHLDELHSLLVGESQTDSQPHRQLIEQLRLRSVSREVSYLEYIRLTTQRGIEVKLYQDGLTILSIKDDYLETAERKLKQFMTAAWGPLLAALWPNELHNHAEAETSSPLLVAGPWVHQPSSVLLASLGQIKSQQKDDDTEVISTSTHTVVIAPNQSTELIDLVEMHLYCRELNYQSKLLLKQARSIQQSINRLQHAATIQPSQLATYFKRAEHNLQRVNQSLFWLGEAKRSVVARQKIVKDLGFDQALENLFFHSPANLLTSVDSIQAHYTLLANTLGQQFKQLSWWQRYAVSRRSGLTQTFLLTLTVLFIGYICFGPDKLRFDNGGGLVLTLMVVGSFGLSLLISLLLQHQEYSRKE